MVKYIDVEQGTVAWLEARLGIPTSSNFDKIVTPGGKFSTQSRAYAIYLVTEKLLQRQLENIDQLEWIARGKELEPDAVKAYEFHTDLSTRQVGFITNDAGTIGCSPDRLHTAVAGGLEIKCPAPHTHIGYMLDGWDKKYLPQIMGQMLVAELDFVDRWSYHPELPPVLERTYRDEKFIRTLSDALGEFNDMRMEMLERALSNGAVIADRAILTTMEEQYPTEV